MDRMTITDLLYREARGMDSHDHSLIAMSYTEDCRYEIDQHVLIGRDNLIAVYKDARGARARTWGVDSIESITHSVDNVLVEVQDDRAEAQSMLTGTAIGKRDGVVVMRTRNVWREDHLVREGNRWLIAHRRQTLQWMVELDPRAVSIKGRDRELEFRESLQQPSS